MPSLAFVALFAFVGWSYALTLLYPISLLAGATYSVQWSGQPSFLFTVEQFHPNKTLQSIITDNNITYLQIDVPAGIQIGFVIEDSITPSLASDILTPNPLLSASISLASQSLLASTTSTLSTASPVSSTTATTTKRSGSASPTTSPTQNTHHNHTVAIVVGCVIGGLFLISFVFRCCSGGGGDFSFGFDVNV